MIDIPQAGGILRLHRRRTEGYRRGGDAPVQRQGCDDQGHVIRRKQRKRSLRPGAEARPRQRRERGPRAAVRIRKVANGGDADADEGAWRGCTGRYRLGYPKVIHAIVGGHRNSIDSGQLAVIGIAAAVSSRGSLSRMEELSYRASDFDIRCGGNPIHRNRRLWQASREGYHRERPSQSWGCCGTRDLVEAGNEMKQRSRLSDQSASATVVWQRPPTLRRSQYA